MQVLITGADGFIGQNLVAWLETHADFELLLFTRKNCPDDLKRFALKADSVVHLAGINRPINDSEFVEGNIEFTQKLCNALTISGNNVPVIYSSSIQVGADTPYGKSKRTAELILEEYSLKTGSDLFIYRLTNVFGKWCRPNYNSVVATFCHNIANELPIKINNPKAELNLVYIDDVVKDFLSVLKREKKSGFVDVSPVYKISLEDLSDQIHKFAENRETLITEPVGHGLIRALYATYLSYIKPARFSYPLERHGDERGIFVEVLKTKDSGQFSYFTADPGVTRGGHYHHTKSEKFLVVSGQAQFRFQNVVTGEKLVIDVNDDESEVVETIPGWAHDITNTGDSKMVVLLWANEIFTPEKPDTFAFGLIE
nr:NAD-dependent epimerase/dehydratase family protein [uncultured Desulfobacter sp.]